MGSLKTLNGEGYKLLSHSFSSLFVFYGTEMFHPQGKQVLSKTNKRLLFLDASLQILI